ncbi:dTDP-glucose 4,6-dehydratase [hydrothermal vent metagenome]|uniref:dTDP-glucose 4,6-dehydratase n=1 Tax=hydrothermal vent metagenome TaxID=652676 RepID=A0A3B1E6Z8_9ZZZZ
MTQDPPQHHQHSTGPDRGRRCALVTGGAGFIGSHLVEFLLARGDAVTVIDNLSTGSRDNLPDHDHLEFLEADLADAIPCLATQGRTFDEIYHLAAAVGVQLVMDAPGDSIKTNIVDTIALIEFAARAPSPPPTLIASSSEVYGKGAKSPFTEDDDIVFGPTTIARWSYGMSKGIDEHLALAHHRATNFPVVIARFFNTVGPRQIGRYGMVLPRFVAAALAGKPLIVHGTGDQTRCFCDVRDVSAALPALLANPACRGRVFNLGSDTEITIRQLAERVIATLGSASTIQTIPYEHAFPEGFEDLPRRRPDLARLRSAIDFAPTYALEQTICDVAEHLRTTHANPAGQVQP